MSLSKINASWISGHNENTLALANINFDFALVKIEPPAEYKELGKALSSSRRKVAEDGDLHQTARRLSVLFRSMLPTTPNLLKAYGTRVSEISRCEESSRSGTPRVYAMFSDWAGIDATSIWAAATSGPSAISVHLLACMIARMFTVSEATSIWFELVQRRQDQLKQAEADGLANDSDLSASRCTISRVHLGEWDASARAWLQTADRAMAEPQNRLMKALGGLGLPIQSDTDILRSVMDVCRSTLLGMEKLIGGTAQRAESPAALLGLSCWHIYPDLLVLGSEDTAPIKQHDPLVNKGGLLTIGMKMEAETEGFLSWSLPLSFLRWYGDPVTAEGQLGLDNSRISPDELRFVVLGCLFALWGPQASDNIVASSWVSLIHDLVEESRPPMANFELKTLTYQTLMWLPTLRKAADRFLDSQGEERREYQRLLSLGRRRRVFLLDAKPDLPNDRESDRNEASMDSIQKASLQYNRIEKASLKPMFGFLEFDTILESLNDSHERITFLRKVATHKGLDPRRYLIRYSAKGGSSWTKRVYEFASIDPILAPFSIKRAHSGEPKPYSNLENARFYSSQHSESESARLSGERIISMTDEFLGIDSNQWIPMIANALASLVRLPRHAITERGEILESDPHHYVGSEVTKISSANMQAVIAGCRFDHASLLSQFTKPTLEKENHELLTNLSCFADINNIYKLLPSASISTKILQRPMPTAFRSHTENGETKTILTTARAFAIVAYCESGQCITDPAALEHVFAMSTGNSIYISGALLSDPSSNVEPFELRRLHGNIGRPGIAMLIPPLNPRIRKSEGEHWRLVNHEQYDMTAADCFAGTTLHLSFTNFVLPLNLQNSGNRDVESYQLESVVSIHDKGRWVADIDILGALKDVEIVQKVCGAACSSTSYHHSLSRLNELVSVDCWEELLEPPEGNVITRAQNNWIGRLALVSLATRLGYSVIVLPNGSCPQCLEQVEAKYGPLTADGWAVAAPYLRSALIM